MATVINSRILWTITLIITIFSLSLPAYAKYSGGTGEPNDPYQIATAEDLMLPGESPEEYDKHFILTTDAATVINRSPAITLEILSVLKEI